MLRSGLSTQMYTSLTINPSSSASNIVVTALWLGQSRFDCKALAILEILACSANQLLARGLFRLAFLVLFQPRHLNRFQPALGGLLGVVLEIGQLSDPLMQVRVAEVGGI